MALSISGLRDPVVPVVQPFGQNEDFEAFATSISGGDTKKLAGVHVVDRRVGWRRTTIAGTLRRGGELAERRQETGSTAMAARAVTEISPFLRSGSVHTRQHRCGDQGGVVALSKCLRPKLRGWYASSSPGT